jgi:hypothetical protein
MTDLDRQDHETLEAELHDARVRLGDRADWLSEAYVAFLQAMLAAREDTRRCLDCGRPMAKHTEHGPQCPPAEDSEQEPKALPEGPDLEGRGGLELGRLLMRAEKAERRVAELEAAAAAVEQPQETERRRFLLVRTDDRVLVCDPKEWGSVGMPVGYQVEAIAVTDPTPTGADRPPCDECGGSGVVEDLVPGVERGLESTCPACRGEGSPPLSGLAAALRRLGEAAGAGA